MTTFGTNNTINNILTSASKTSADIKTVISSCNNCNMRNKITSITHRPVISKGTSYFIVKSQFTSN